MVFHIHIFVLSNTVEETTFHNVIYLEPVYMTSFVLSGSNDQPKSGVRPSYKQTGPDTGSALYT